MITIAPIAPIYLRKTTKNKLAMEKFKQLDARLSVFQTVGRHAFGRTQISKSNDLFQTKMPFIHCDSSTKQRWLVFWNKSPQVFHLTDFPIKSLKGWCKRCLWLVRVGTSTLTETAIDSEKLGNCKFPNSSCDTLQGVGEAKSSVPTHDLWLVKGYVLCDFSRLGKTFKIHIPDQTMNPATGGRRESWTKSVRVFVFLEVMFLEP